MFTAFLPIILLPLIVTPVGDSLTAGFPDYTSSYPVFLREFTENIRLVGRVDGLHEGVGGRTAQDVLDNIAEIVSADNPDVIVLMVGTNDILQGCQEPTKVLQIIEAARAVKPDVAFIVSTVPIVKSKRDQTVEYNVGLRSQPYPARVVLVDPAAQLYDSFYWLDGIHLMPDGYRAIARELGYGIELLRAIIRQERAGQ